MLSLRIRLFGLWLVSLSATAAAAVPFVQLYQQSNAAQIARADAVVANACTAISERYAFYLAGSSAPVVLGPSDHAGLVAAVALALHADDGVSGGLRQAGTGSLARATGPGAGDAPLAEAIIQSANDAASRDEQTVVRTTRVGERITVIAACPAGGPVADVTAWAATEVTATPGLDRLRLGLGALLALMLAMSGWLGWLAATWSRHVARIEVALAGHDIEALPVLPRTGERELDRIVDALNDAGVRLAQARARAGAAERLAAIGRVAAGLAHEIRNPIAAMRLRAENALAGDDARRATALDAILGQIARLDRLLAELLAMTQLPTPHPERVDLARLLADCAADHADAGARAGVAIVLDAKGSATLDPALTRRAIDALVQNAIAHTPAAGSVTLHARADASGIEIRVTDTGPGVADSVRATLFEPFVTGRPDGTGLGLAIARELTGAQGGQVRLMPSATGAVFVMDFPAGDAWPAS